MRRIGLLLPAVLLLLLVLVPVQLLGELAGVVVDGVDGGAGLQQAYGEVALDLLPGVEVLGLQVDVGLEGLAHDHTHVVRILSGVGRGPTRRGGPGVRSGVL